MKLQILIPSLPSRMTTYLSRLLERLKPQIADRNDVGILINIDNKLFTVGEKRNQLLDAAEAEFISFIDDDDLVSEDYVSSIIDRINSIHPNNPVDCIVFDSIVTINGGIQQLCKYGIEFKCEKCSDGSCKYGSASCNFNNPTPPDTWFGKPSHTMVWKRSMISEKYFPPENFGEDTAWVSQCWPLIRKQERIDKILYFYEFNDLISETRC